MKLSKWSLLTILFVTVSSLAFENFADDLKTANDLRGQARGIINKPDYKPDKILPNYNPKPAESKYFSGVSQGTDNGLTKDAAKSIQSPTETSGQAGKSVTDAFKTRPVFTIDSTAPSMTKSKIIEKDSYDISHGIPDKYTDCKATQKCTTTYVKNTCNEATRSATKNCEKSPQVTVTPIPVIYPNCQKLVRLQGCPNHCPAGYTQTLYADMIDGPTWDDLYFCTKNTPTTEENSECYSGAFYVARTATKISGFPAGAGFFGNGQVTVPAHLHAWIMISNVYKDFMVGTVINLTTGQTLYDQVHFTDGQRINLPFSDMQDQTFKFYATRQQVRWFWDQGNYGVMALYIDHKGEAKTVRVDWNEVCHDAS